MAEESAMMSYVALGAGAIGVACLARVLLALWSWLQMYKEWSKIPGPTGEHPVLGFALTFMSPKLLDRLEEEVNQYNKEGIFRARIAHMLWVVVTDPQEISKFMRRTPSTATTYLGTKPRDVYKNLDRGITASKGNILSLSDGPEHTAVRKAVAPTFGTASLKRVFPKAVELAKTLTQRLGREGAGGVSVDVDKPMKALTLDIIAELLYGHDLGQCANPSPEIVHIVEGCMRAAHEMIANPLWDLYSPFTAHGREQHSFLNSNEAFIAKKVAEMQKVPPPEHTIGAALLKATVEGRPLTLTQLKSHVNMMTIAGFETSSHTLCMTLGLLAAYPDVQAKLAAELEGAGLLATAFSPEPRDFAWADLNALPYLGAVMKESLRMLPAAPSGSLREVTQEGGIELCGYSIPKGAMVDFTPIAVGRNQAVYGPTAADFIPERWLEWPDRESYPPEGWAFSLGPRDCVGQSLARLEIQVGIATLLGRYSLALAPEVNGRSGFFDRVVYHITLQAEGGMPLVLTPRTRGAQA